MVNMVFTCPGLHRGSPTVQDAHRPVQSPAQKGSQRQAETAVGCRRRLHWTAVRRPAVHRRHRCSTACSACYFPNIMPQAQNNWKAARKRGRKGAQRTQDDWRSLSAKLAKAPARRLSSRSDLIDGRHVCVSDLLLHDCCAHELHARESVAVPGRGVDLLGVYVNVSGFEDSCSIWGLQ